MGRHRLARPERTDLTGSLVTDGKNEVEWWCVGHCKLVPGFAAEICGTQTSLFELVNGLRPHGSRRMTSSAVGSEIRGTLTIHDRFGHDRAGGVSCTQKQHVVVRHRSVLWRFAEGLGVCLRLDGVYLHAGRSRIDVVLR